MEPRSATEKQPNAASKINFETNAISELSTEILDYALGIEQYLIGQHSLPESEGTIEKSNTKGWYEEHWNALCDIKTKLIYIKDTLKRIKTESE